MNNQKIPSKSGHIVINKKYTNSSNSVSIPSKSGHVVIQLKKCTNHYQQVSIPSKSGHVVIGQKDVEWDVRMFQSPLNRVML